MTMKISAMLSFAVALMVSACGSSSNEANTRSSTGELSGMITMSGAYAMYPMAIKWGEEFKKLHPNVQFDIQAGGAGKGMTDVVSGTVDFGMVSRAINPEEEAKGAYAIGVTIDAVIPTISADNPYYSIIYQKGVSRKQLEGIFLTETIKTWGDLLGNGATENIQRYTRSDACGAGETFAKYLQRDAQQEDIKGIGVFGDPGLAEAVSKSRFGIGYNNVNFTYDASTRKPNKGMGVLPLDVDENGLLDPAESVYDNLDSLNHAIAAGIFPSPPARMLYLVHKGQPDDPVKIEFLKWILTEGQQFCGESGYIQLSEEKLKEQQARIPSSVQ